METFWKTFLDILFPQKCIGCGASKTNLCVACISSIPGGVRFPEHNFIHALYDYRHPLIKQAIGKLKYKNAQNVAECFGGGLFEEIVGVLSEKFFVSPSEKFLLVPIPLHKKRLRERGYNQSELIAKAIMRQDKHNVFALSTAILTRTKETRSQARSEKRAVRIKNLQDAFICSAPSLVQGQTIILIDDVTTTGATLFSAKKALSHARPRAVFAFTIAH